MGALLIALSLVHFGEARPGDLDPTFGVRGKVTTAFGRSDEALALVLQPDGKLVAGNPSVSGGTFREEPGEGICREAPSTWVEDGFPGRDHLHRPLLQGVPPRHQHTTRLGAGVRRRTAADLAGHDGGPQLAPGQVGRGWDLPVVSPVIKAIDLGPGELLETTHAEGVGGLRRARDARRVERRRGPSALAVREALRPSPSGQGAWGGHGPDPGAHRGHVRALLRQLLARPPQMAVAILPGAGDLVVASVAPDHQAPWPPSRADDLLGPAGRPALAAQDQAAPGGGRTTRQARVSRWSATRWPPPV